MKKRVFGLDLVRAVAFFFVILVHSFSRSEFNNYSLAGFQMFSLRAFLLRGSGLMSQERYQSFLRVPSSAYCGLHRDRQRVFVVRS